MSVINFVLNYWYVFVVAVVVVGYCVYECKLFYKLPNSEKVKKIKVLLLSLVSKACEKYDEGDLDLIIATVYDEFCSKFPIIKSFIPIDVVKGWIKEAFEELKKLLQLQNKTIASLHAINK